MSGSWSASDLRRRHAAWHVREAASEPRGGGSDDAVGAVPKAMLQRTCWRYIDALTLYGPSDLDLGALWNTLGTGAYLEQCGIELAELLEAESKRRGVRIRDVEAELVARANAMRLPSATGVPPTGTAAAVAYGPASARRADATVGSFGARSRRDRLG